MSEIKTLTFVTEGRVGLPKGLPNQTLHISTPQMDVGIVVKDGACSQNAKADCRHCWHGTGVMLASNPPKVEEICCWCGEKRYLFSRVLVLDGKHGEFAPFR
jgi:hypothetical protein